MSCIYGDQPLRIQMIKDGVIHAGSYQEYGGFSRSIVDPISGRVTGYREVPKQKRVRMVCRRSFKGDPLAEDHLVDNSTIITCKHCMRLMGLIDDSKDAERFVIINTETGEFYKNTSTRCSTWSESIYEAFFFKRRGTALTAASHHEYEVDGKLLKYKEWVAAGRPKIEKHVQVLDPNREIREVKITVV